ncbi:MAG: response regulator [Flavobacteriales bacterium]|nr:response regulator [Flavobacteriales bacterium]
MNNPHLHILLADDDESDRLLFTEAFRAMKLRTEVHTVNDGVQLMAWLNREDVTLPHLIFLDLNMPRKNGLECLKEIRSNKALSTISIAIYSTSASEKDISDTFINGANVYIKKPTDFAILKKVLTQAVMATYYYQEPPFNRDNFLLRIDGVPENTRKTQ